MEVQELINNKGRGLNLSGLGQEGMKHCTEQGNIFSSLNLNAVSCRECFVCLVIYLDKYFVSSLFCQLVAFSDTQLVLQFISQSFIQIDNQSFSETFIYSVSQPFTHFDEKSVIMSVSRLVSSYKFSSVYRLSLDGLSCSSVSGHYRQSI